MSETECAVTALDTFAELKSAMMPDQGQHHLTFIYIKKTQPHPTLEGHSTLCASLQPRHFLDICREWGKSGL